MVPAQSGSTEPLMCDNAKVTEKSEKSEVSVIISFVRDYIIKVLSMLTVDAINNTMDNIN